MIDSHHHLWDPAQRDYPWLAGAALAPIRKPYGLADLRAVTEPAGVRGTVLVQTVSSVAETEEFLAVAEAGDGLVAGVVGWVNLVAPDVADRVAELRSRPGGSRLVGIRHQVENEADPDWLRRPDVRRGLAALGAAGLAYDLLVNPAQYAAAADTADSLPHATFVLDHLGKPPVAKGELEPWAAWITELARRPNVYAKLSGLVTEADWAGWKTDDLAPFAAHALTEFGPDRVMVGSDWPVCELAASYDEVFGAAREVTAGLSDAERAAVFDGTARRVYRLAA